MQNSQPVSSKLNCYAEEFIPVSEIKKRILTEFKSTVTPLFDKNVKFDIQSEKIRNFIEVSPPNIARWIGEVFVEICSEQADRAIIGFRCFQSIRDKIPENVKIALENGIINICNRLCEDIISNTFLRELPIITSSNNTDCQLDTTAYSALNQHILAISTFLKLILLNMSPMMRTSQNFIQPYIDFCKLLKAICEIQLKIERNIFNYTQSSFEADFKLIESNNWNSILYNLFDGFYQIIPHVNNILTQQNSRLICGSWQRTQGTVEQSTDPCLTISEGFGDVSKLANIMSSCLNDLRCLLLDERLPLKILRSTVLDALLHASEIAALQNYQQWQVTNNGESNSFHSNESLDDFDEKEEDYHKFLEFSGQIATK